MIAALAPRSFARAAASGSRSLAAARPAARKAYATEKGPAGVPISGGGGDNNTLLYTAVGLGGAGLIWYYFSSSQAAQKDGASAGGSGVAGFGHHDAVTNQKQNLLGTRLNPGDQDPAVPVKK